MKKILAALLALISMMTASAFAEDKLSIVCTTFPQYDWVRQILGAHADDVELTLLLDNGIDLHNYQPTAADIAKISSSDLFIYVGGESDGWVDDVLEAAQNPNLKAISMLASVEAKEEEVVEGMQETEHDHDHSKEVSTFEDDQVQDRALSDWAGDWQSAYPFALDGTLDEAFAAMAESGKMTADEYKAYYQTGYKSDIQDIKINGDHIAFTYDDGKTVESDYRYVGYYIQNWSTGTKAAMYRFEAVDQGSGAPVYIEFNDHMIESAAVEHFHLRMSDESFDAIVDPEKSWPTFFPADMTGEEICEHLIGHDHDEETEYDEHVWLSLCNAKMICETITDALCALDPAHAVDYRANDVVYEDQLSALDVKYQEVTNNSARRTILFADRFPFRYLADDYSLTYYAAFVGCSAETEASFETIAFLAKKVDELKLPVVLTIEGDNHAIAETVVANTQAKDQKIMTMNSIQSVTANDMEDGVTYLGIMTDNLDVLRAALH